MLQCTRALLVGWTAPPFLDEGNESPVVLRRRTDGRSDHSLRVGTLGDAPAGGRFCVCLFIRGNRTVIIGQNMMYSSAFSSLGLLVSVTDASRFLA